jgi:hypothetical protein
VERHLDEPGMRRALKDPLYGPLRAELTPPHQGKGVRFLRRSREGGSQRKSGGGKEDGTFFEKPAPKINLVEAHWNRPSPQEKGQRPTTEQEKLKSFQGILPNEGSGGARPQPPDDRGSGAGERFTLCIGPPPPPRGRAFNIPVDTLGGKDIFP